MPGHIVDAVLDPLGYTLSGSSVRETEPGANAVEGESF